MNDKAALELSVNAIVILIIALAVMGLVIGFVFTKFRQVDRFKIEEPTPEPDSYSPIQTPGGRDSFTFSKKSEIEMEVRFYNMDSEGFDSLWTNSTQIECVGQGGIYYFTPQLPQTYVAGGQEASIPMIFKVEPEIPVGVYACQILFRGESFYTIDQIENEPKFNNGEPIAERYLEIEVT